MKITKRQLKRIVKESCAEMAVSLEKGVKYGDGGDAKMARGQLYHISQDAANLHDMLNDEDELPEWVQSKIAVTKHNIDAILDYLEYQHRDHLGGEDILQ